MKVINFFAGPGAGKSTCAAELFAAMKREHHKVELVTEYAKDLVYEGTLDKITQEKIFAEQHWRQARLMNEVDYLITDSPLLLSVVYGPQDKDFCRYVYKVFNSFDNFNIFVNRPDTYQPFGRSQTLDESKVIDNLVLKTIQDYHVTLHMIINKNGFNPQHVKV